jgi:tetratricopeptide (TPR) repeat protein
MPPEQARGEVERVDRRSDVFGLGAILCELLTGLPPFAGKDMDEVLDRAQRCDHTEALARLGGCGADVELVRLCKGCLAAAPADRPGDAGEVAQAVAAYRAEVQERLRRAELEKAAAQAREEEAKATAEAERRAAEVEKAAAAEAKAAAEARAAGERKRRRLAVVLTAAVVALALGGTAWAWQRWESIRLTEADLDKAAQLLDAEQLPACREALKRAEGRLGGGGPAGLRQRAEELRDLLGVVRRLEQARLTRASGVREGYFDWASADEAYEKEFERYGLAGDNPDVEEVARRISASPIKGLLVAALDDWGKASKERRSRLLAVASRVDTDTWRARLRAAFARADKAEMLRLAKEAEPEQLPLSTQLMLGMALGWMGSDEAVRVLEAGQRLYPGDFWVNHELAWWLLHQKPSRPGEAVGYYRAALAARPDSPGTYVNLGNALRAQGRPKEAEAEYRAALRLAPDYPQAHICLGVVLLNQGRRKEAEAEYREALRLKPDDPLAHSNLGVALWEQGRPKEAETECRAALRLKPNFPDAHLGLGAALRDQGRLKEAEAECREALRLNPDYPMAHGNLGNALLDQGRPKEAEAEYRAALRLQPDYPKALFGLGTALGEQGRPKEAEAEYRAALRLKPDYPEARYSLGNALSAQGRPKEAEAECRAALRLKPDDPMAHNNLGNALGEQGRPKEAEAEYRAALRLKPDYPEAHTNLGNALSAQGRPKEAEAECRAALRLKPDFLAAHSNLGIALSAQGRLEEAEAEFREALRLKPDDPSAHNNLGLALYEEGRVDEAVGHYEKALRLDPKCAQAQGALGQALLAQGRWPEARNATRRCLELLPDRHPLRAPGTAQLRQCERMLALEARLPAVLAGKDKPAGAECLDFARLCRGMKRYAAAARFYADAFAPDPKLTADPRSSNRYHAACAASLAAAGQGEDATSLAEEGRARLRQQALDWLRADLALWAKMAGEGTPQTRQLVARALPHWQKHPDLASLRDKAALDKLPTAERDAWQRLWADVDALLKRVWDGTPFDAKPSTPLPGPLARPVRFEAEYLKIVAREGCEAGVQDMGPWDRSRWSNGRQLFCRAQQGGYVELEAHCPEAGRYQLAVGLTRADDFGIVQVSLDGQKVGEPFDGFHSVVEPSGKIKLGAVELTRGAHRVRFTVVGKNARSKQHYMGIDYLELRPVR